MKVLHVVPSYLPATRYGGPIVSVHALCAALMRAGHQVDVVTTNVDGPGDSAVALGVRVERDGVGVHYFASRWLRRLYWSPPMKSWLRSHVGDYDLVHLHSVFLWPTLAAARAAEAAAVPFVLSPRGMLVRELLRVRSRWLKSAWINLFERRSLAAAAAVHFTSTVEIAAFDDLRFQTQAIRAVIPNGVDLPADSPAPAEHPAYVLMLGRISWKKRIERGIAALVGVPGLHLVVAGGDDEGLLPALRQQAERLGVADRVDFVGPVDGQKKQQLLHSARALVMVSHSENFGNVVLEALAQATPAIVLAEIGAAEVVRVANAGWVIEDSTEALSACLRRVLADPGEAAERGRRGAVHVSSTLGWDQIATRMTALYAEIIAGNKHADPGVLQHCCKAGSMPRSSPGTSMLTDIVPVILTWNEEANIGRVLEALRWARRVVVLDSGSSDATPSIARGFANVDWRERAFDSHAAQCNYALDHLVEASAWVLFMDADYIVTDTLREQIAALLPDPETSAYRIPFRYCIDGVPLAGTLYPPRVALFRPERGRYVQEGHAHLLQVQGPVIDLTAPMLHDDRKPRERFVANQHRYAELEAAWLRGQRFVELRWADRVRRMIVIAPWLAPLMAYTVRGVWRDGRVGLKYIGERALAEYLIARELLRKG